MKVDTNAKYVQVVDCSGGMFWYRDKIGKVFEVTGIRDENYVVRVGDSASNHWIGVSDCIVVNEIPVEQPSQKAIDSHYSTFIYTLSVDDKKNGTLKVDPYFVAKQWGLGKKDDTGVLFHCLKNISRYSDKNTKEREIKALYLQVKRLAELENVNLE